MGMDITMYIKAKLSLLDFIYKIDHEESDEDEDEDEIDTEVEELRNFIYEHVTRWSIYFEPEPRLDIDYNGDFDCTDVKKRLCKYFRWVLEWDTEIDQKIFSLYKIKKGVILKENGKIVFYIDDYSSYKGKDNLDIDYLKIGNKIKQLKDFWGGNIDIYIKSRQRAI